MAGFNPGKVIWKGSDLGGDMVIARTSENGEEQFGQPLYNLAVVVGVEVGVGDGVPEGTFKSQLDKITT